MSPAPEILQRIRNQIDQGIKDVDLFALHRKHTPETFAASVQKMTVALESARCGCPASVAATTRFRVQKVLAAVIGPINQPQAVVVGLPIHGRLRIVGRSTPLSASAGRDLARYLRPQRGKHPWPEEISERLLDRFTKESGSVRLTLVEPVVVEVSADVAWSGRAFRHSVRLVRVRPELDPAEVALPAWFPS